MAVEPAQNMAANPEASGSQNASQAETPQTLKKWWAGFKRRSEKDEQKGSFISDSYLTLLTAPDAVVKAKPGIFGIPLEQSIKYANVAISLDDGRGGSFIYGYVPIVVAKCGVFLKEKGGKRLEAVKQIY